MCGVNGFLSFSGKHSREYRHDIVHGMNQKILYRGPDSEGFFDGHWLTMGMRRLAIIDLKKGDQPVYSQSGEVIVEFNGEIYNYIELREHLTQKGYVFRTESDTEVIGNLFQEYGEKSFSMLDGMFAITLYERLSDSFYLVRDRMGEKPLYYYADKEKMLYGSELKSLKGTGLVPAIIHRQAMNLFFQYTYIPSPFSIYQDVFKVRPGHFLKVSSNGNMKDQCYWELKRNKEFAFLSYEEAKEELRKRLTESVKKRMRSDVPFGAFLSGGLDSGTIAALMAQNSEKPIRTFTIGLKSSDDESGRAKRMASYLGTDHQSFILDYKDSIRVIPEIMEHMDEPFADSSCIPEFIVSKLASEHVRVALTGDAGDELFLGYSKYLIDYYADKYLKIPEHIRRGLIKPVFDAMPDRTTLSRQVGKVIRTADMEAFQRRNRMMQLGFKEEEMRQLLHPDYYDNGGQQFIRDYYESVSGSDIERTQYVDLHVVLEGDMLTKVDRMSMIHSLETRTPMLSNDLVEFAYSIPTEYKLKGKILKRIVKDTFRDCFPKGYDKLPKSGFGVPIDDWFRDEMKEELMELFSRPVIKQQGFFNYEFICKILEEHFKGERNRKFEIWCLYVFQKWYAARDLA